jgi:hypothetical protein
MENKDDVRQHSKMAENKDDVRQHSKMATICHILVRMLQ